MSATKDIEALGIQAKKESVYKTIPALVATDAIQVMDKRPKFTRKNLFDGKRRRGQAALVNLQMAPKNGFYYELQDPIDMEAKGSGAAYSASVKPPNVHQWLQAAGFTEAVTTTPGLEKVEYTITGPTVARSSLGMKVWTAAEEYALAGGYMNYEFLLEDSGIIKSRFSNGMWVEAADPLDAALPTQTYQAGAVMPLAAAGITFTIGTFLLPIPRRIAFTCGRIAPTVRRNLVDATAHAGFHPGWFEPRLTFLMEKTALVGTPFHSASGLNTSRLVKDSTVLSCDINCGSVQYNRVKHNFPNGIQLLEATETEEDGIAMVEVIAEPFGSGPSDSGFVKVTYD